MSKELIITLSIIGALLLLGIIIFLYFYLSKHKKSKQEKENVNKIFSLLGGKENILSLSAKGSRLSFTLKDKDKFDEAGIKNLGITSIIYMSNKITIVIGSLSQDIEKAYLSK